MLLLYLAKWNTLLAVTQQHQKGTKFHKNRSLLVHIVELSTAVVKVDIKVINASLTQNQCLQYHVNAALNACWDTVTARRQWTEQWRHDQVRQCPLPNRTEFINFSETALINDDSSFCSLILSATDLQYHVFSFWKASVKVRLCL